MIEMFVAVEDQLDLFRIKPETGGIKPNARCATLSSGVDEDVSRIGDDKESADATCPDIKYIVSDLERRGRLVPIIPRLA